MSPARKESGKLIRAALRYLRKQGTRAEKRLKSGHLTPHQLDHLMRGEIPTRKGYHYRPGGEDFPNRRVGPTIARDPHTGVYSAPVEFERPPGSGTWVPKVGNQGASTFYPDHWTPKQVDDAVPGAFNGPGVVKNSDGSWTGSHNGVNIKGYWDPQTGALRHGFPYL